MTVGKMGCEGKLAELPLWRDLRYARYGAYIKQLRKKQDRLEKKLEAQRIFQCA